MSDITNQKIGEIIAFAESLSEADKNKSVDTARIAEVRAKAQIHARDHDLILYVGTELGIRTKFVKQAISLLHPNEEVIKETYEQLGILKNKDYFWDISAKLVTEYGAKFCASLSVVRRDTKFKLYRGTHRLSNTWSIEAVPKGKGLIMHHIKDYFKGTVPFLEFKIFNTVGLIEVHLNDPRGAVVLKDLLEAMREEASSRGITVRLFASEHPER